MSLGKYGHRRYLSALNRARKLWMRDWVIALLRARYGRSRGAVAPAACRRVGVLLQDHGIGDAIVVSGLIHRLRDSGRSVFVVAQPSAAAIYQSMIAVDGLVICKERCRIQTLAALREQQLDLVIDFGFYPDFHALWRMRALLYLRPRYAIGFNAFGRFPFDVDIATSQYEHVTRRVRKVLRVLQLDQETYSYQLRFNPVGTQPARDWVEDLRQRHKRVVIFNPFASSRHRSLSISQIHAVCRHLDAVAGTVTVVFCLGREVDLTSYRSVVANPFPDLENSFRLVAESDYVITVDTSIVHLAAAFDIPQCCICNNKVTSTNVANIVWAPIGSNATQMFTSTNEGSSDGDDVSQFDVARLLAQLDWCGESSPHSPSNGYLKPFQSTNGMMSGPSALMGDRL